MSARFLSAIVLLGALASSTSAFAAEPTKSDPAMIEARARFEEGLKHAEAGDHEAARLKFNQAWALLKSPAVLYNLARAEQLSNHPVEALEHSRLFSKLPADPKVTDTQRQRAAENVVELAKKVGQIRIEADPTARVTVDGRAIELGAEPIPVAPGRHVVEGIANGKTKTVAVECEAGATALANLTEPAPAVVAPITPPPAEPRERFWSAGRLGGAAAFGAGLVAIGAGIFFRAAANEADDDATKLRAGLPEGSRSSACTTDPTNPACGELRATIDDQRRDERLGAGFFIGGGVLAVTGAVLFIIAPRAARTGMTITPTASARAAGLAVGGRF